MILTLTVVALVALGALLYFWHNVAYYFQTTVIPWVRSNMGDSYADTLGDIFSFADNASTLTRRKIKEGWQWMHENILGSESVYEQINASNVKVDTKTYLNNGDSVQVITGTRTVSWDDLPAPIRERMIQNNVSSVKVDERPVLEEQYKARAEKEGVSLTQSST